MPYESYEKIIKSSKGFGYGWTETYFNNEDKQFCLIVKCSTCDYDSENSMEYCYSSLDLKEATQLRDELNQFINMIKIGD